MSSKLITEKPESGTPAPDWRLPETAPSLVRVDEPTLGRVVGFIGLMCLALGGTALLLHAVNWTRGIGPGWGTVFAVAGMACLLFHAACDGEMQVRRVYGLVGYLWLAVAVLVTVLPIKGASGTQFLPYGFSCLVLGLLFLLPFVRHETDPQWRRITLYTLGGVGAALAVAGFLFGNVLNWFLLPYGLLVSLLGLFFLWAFIGFHGSASDIGYRTALALGALGLGVVAVAVIRSLVTRSYFVPDGLVLMGLGLLYATFSAGLCWDNRLVVMTRRELGGFFFSPIAYFVLFGLTLVGWLFFWQFIDILETRALARARLEEPIIRNYLLSWFPIICVIFIVPVLTMRLLSEEQRTGTLEVLFTAPLGEVAVVLSKFLAAFIFYMMLWLPWGLFLIALWVGNGEPFEYRPLLTFYIMLACTGAHFLAMGLFFSSLTRNQIIAAVLTFAGMLMWTSAFFIKGMLEDSPTAANNPWIPILTHMSYIDIWLESLKGVLTPHWLLFHVSMAIFWLFLTVKVLESRTWR